MAEDAGGLVIAIEHDALTGHHHADRGELESGLVIECGHGGLRLG
jgi:hypothetical protein